MNRADTGPNCVLMNPMVQSYDVVRKGQALQSHRPGLVTLCEGGPVHAVALEDGLPGDRFLVRWDRVPRWAMDILNDPMIELRGPL